MNGDTLYALRNALDADEAWMAKALGLTGEHASKTIHAMETGRKPISGPVQELLRRVGKDFNYELHNGNWIKTDE